VPSDSLNHDWDVDDDDGDLLEEQEEPEEVQIQAFALKFLYEAMNGALVQSVFTIPPLVAQLSAFQRLEYILMAWFFGKATPFDSKFLNSLIGIPSTEKLYESKILINFLL